MKETNEKTTKQLDEKELEQVTGGTGENQTNPAAPDTQGDEGQKITGSACTIRHTPTHRAGDEGQKITGSACVPNRMPLDL